MKKGTPKNEIGPLKIVTVNVPESYLKAIDKLIGKDGIYPSRSELVRTATRELLIKELKKMKNIKKYNTPEIEEPFDDKNFVRVPIIKKNENNEPIREFKEYKIIQRLD